MTWHHRPIRASAVAVLGLAMTAAMGGFASVAASAAPAVPAGYTALTGSVPPTADPQTGPYSAASMAIQVALQPRNPAGLASALQGIYTKGSPSYQHWLAAGQFDARYAPSAARTQAVTGFLTKRRPQGGGLELAVHGPGHRVQRAGRRGVPHQVQHLPVQEGRDYFQNSAPVALPSSMASYVQGVTGLTNTIRDQSQIVRPSAAEPAAAGAAAPVPPACESPYPTVAQQFAEVNNGTGIPFGYGDGPGCSGLTPAQDNSIYGAPTRHPRTTGNGRHHRRVRAVGLPALRHQHLGADLLRVALHPAADRRER